jgi:hypothetical protein
MTRARENRLLAALGCVALCLGASACVDLPKSNPLTPGGVDPRSTVAGEVAAAIAAPGPYPTFSKVPAIPTDIRPSTQWKTDVVSVWTKKRRLDAEAAALKFTLNNSLPWADTERAKINMAEAKPVNEDATLNAEAFATEERARATPPPTPK